MDLTLTLYNNSSAPNVVHKRISTIATLSGDLKESVNMEKVSMVIPYNSNYASINYAYIPQFKRYYFVTIDAVNGNLLNVTMKSDPLMSFWGSFSQSKCIAKRSSSNYNPYIVDDRLAFKPQPIYIRRKTASKFTPSSNSGSYILTLGGKEL